MMLLASRLARLDHEAPRPLRIPARYRRVEVPAHAPRISIVIPSHRKPGFFDRTIRSALEQGYEPLELIVEANEGDRLAGELVHRYRDRLAHADIHPRGRTGLAVNLGFEHSTGELMSYLSPDGMLLPGSLPYVARYFERHPGVDVVYGHSVLLDEDDFEVGRWVLPRHDNQALSWTDYVPAQGLFWRRAAWEAVGGAVDEDLQDALEWELVLCFLEAGARIVRVPRFLSGLRVKVDGGATSQNGAYEASRLRERVHGREVTPSEVEKAVRGYVRRRTLLEALYQLRLLRY
jgi:cellulose synthase/poly-beta-1,6-N-acetylglucosamine synthase-like glycosyltransferase